MKKITLFTAVAVFCSITLSAQDVVIDQPVDVAGSALVSFEGNDAIGVYCADDFELTETTILGQLDIYGTLGSNTNPISTFTSLTSISIYIYEDVSGLPDGDPSQDGSSIVEILDITADDFELVEDGTNRAEFLTINITDANGGTQISLDAGIYWLAFAPNVDEAFDTAGNNRWNWSGSTAANEGTEPLLIDPDDQFGAGATDWTNISGLIAASFPSLAFTLRNEEALSTDDNILNNSISLYPNPTNGDLSISFSSDIGTAILEVINVSGQKVLSASLDGINNTNINTSKLSSGVYFAHVSTDDANTTIKFIKN